MSVLQARCRTLEREKNRERTHGTTADIFEQNTVDEEKALVIHKSSNRRERHTDPEALKKSPLNKGRSLEARYRAGTHRMPSLRWQTARVKASVSGCQPCASDVYVQSPPAGIENPLSLDHNESHAEVRN